MPEPSIVGIHTSETAAAALHCTPERIEEAARTGELAGTKVGIGWLFLEEHLLEWLRARALSEAAERRAKVQKDRAPPESGRRRSSGRRLSF